MNLKNLPQVEWTRGRLLAALGAAGFIGVVGLYLFVYAPLLGRLGTERARCLALETEAAQARSQITSLKEAPGPVLVPAGEASLALNELTLKGKLNGVNFISITPKTVVPSAELPVNILPIEMEIESSYEMLSVFLGLLDELERGLVTVSQFTVTPKSEDGSRLLAKVTVHLHLGE